MRQKFRTVQSGYALILMVVALMGIGGIVLTGFTKGTRVEAERERYLHNKRVLQEAKQALLQYAYDYPQLGPGQDDGPGRLPCPDTDNDGAENYVPNCSGNIVGRFPWADPELNFYEALDASGERLWYAVSPDFGRGPGSVINSGSFGGITVEDRSGALLHDGTVTSPGGGVAAVIIAPGAAIDRNGTIQVRGTVDQKKAAVNYLDLFGTRDNAVFVNGSTNGFVTGPIDDMVTGDLLVNDQVIVVTAAEVIAMAEKATLQAYRASINDYLGKVGCTGGSGTTEAVCLADGGSWNPVYPWLYDYREVYSQDELSSLYPAGTPFELNPVKYPDPNDSFLGNYGRIPSIFAEYFTETNSQPIETWMELSLEFINPAGSDSVTLIEKGCINACGSGGTRDFSRNTDDPDTQPPTLDITFSQPLSAVKFVDIDPNTVNNDVRVRATFAVPESIPFEFYFLGVHDDPTTDWTACPNGADELSDCVFSSGDNLSLLRVYGSIEFSDVGDEDFDFDNDFPFDIEWSPADGASQAWITATYPADGIASFPGTYSMKVYYDFDGHWHKGDTALHDGDHDDKDDSNGEVDMSGFSLGSLTLGMRFYPELPAWAYDNGWHDSIRMAYADTYLPSLATDCVPLPDGDNTNDCLFLPEELGSPRNIASLLVIAGEHDWVDDECSSACDGMADELRDVFDNGNNNNNRSFYNRRSISPANSDRGNDKILVIEEL